MLSGMSQSQKDKHCMMYLEQSDSQGKQKDAGQEQGKRNGKLMFNWDRISVWEVERDLEIEGGYDCTECKYN